MFRAPLRRIRPGALPVVRVPAPRRFASTGPAKKGTWKGTAARWGVAAGAVYWYCTSPLFADDPAPQVRVPVAENDEVTVDRVIEQKRKEIEARAREREAEDAEAKKQKEAQIQTPGEPGADGATPEGSPQALEEEAGQQGAFNPETGEINWDCPCLGGMAHGPCGEEFRAAFSCFVYSEEEPKGMDCIDKFQGMQDCFQKHPDVYGAELAEEEEAEAEARAAASGEKERTDGEPQKADVQAHAVADARPVSNAEGEKKAETEANALPKRGAGAAGPDSAEPRDEEKGQAAADRQTR